MRLVTRYPPAVYTRPTRASYPRRYFRATVSLCHDAPEVVRVKVGGSGHVALNIFGPQKTASADSNDVLLVLPSRPSLQTTQPLSNVSSTAPSLLKRVSEAFPSSWVIALNYRLSSQRHPYPVPIHDTATAFDYVANPSSPHNGGHAPRISLIGSHVGGALALMLGLTSPNLIHSLQVTEPLVDWVGLDERMAKAKDPYEQKALAHLLTLRYRLFPSPSAYFDPFASPMLFLRAPGRDTPATKSSSLVSNDEDPYPETNTDADTFGPYDDDMTSAIQRTSPKRRKILRRWPPVGRPEEVILPHTMITLKEGGGLAGILRAQGLEMADLMRKTCFWGSEKGLGEKRVQTRTLADGGSAIDELVRWSRELRDSERHERLIYQHGSTLRRST